MRLFRSARWLLLALLLPLIPASQARAGVFISVGFAPPILPVYVQPPCPQPNLMWAPGYWAYGDDGYYWVPGAWVPAPYEGALWTPGYWGWQGGLYVFRDGYWGPHVGYYGGVNYGFGFGGIGFAGGEWRGGVFAYNTAIVHVNETVIHTTYVNRTIVEQNTVVANSHVAYSGGPGGINHPPTPAERQAMSEPHSAPTQFQQQHVQAARADHSSYAKVNGGHPQNVVAAKPLEAAHYQAPAAARAAAPAARPAAAANGDARGEYAAPDSRPAPEARPAAPAARPAPEAARPTPESRPAPPASRPAPAAKPAPKPKEKEPKR